jgi:hypothetical protein
MITRRVAAVAVAVTALAVVVPAGGAGGAVRAGSVRGVAGKVIKVASISATARYSDIAKGAQARFDLANQKHELPRGYTVNYTGISDDKATTEGTLSEVRRQVEQEQVFGIAGTAATYLTPDYVNQQKVPWIGWGVNDAMCPHGQSNWYVYGITGCLNAVPANAYNNPAWGNLVIAGLKAQGKPTKNVTAAVISEDNDSGRKGVDVVSKSAQAAGMKVVFEKANIPPAPAVVSDFAPYVQDIITSNNGGQPDVFFNVATVANVIGLSTALRQAGFKGLDTNSIGYAPVLTTTAAGWAAYTQWATPESADDGNAAMKEIVTNMNKAGVTSISQVGLMGWFSADMFLGITKAALAKDKTLTLEGWQKAASKFTYEVKDTIGPTVYPGAYAAGTPCGALVMSNGTTWDITAKYQCFPDVIDAKTGKLVPYTKVNPKASA